MFFKTMRKSEIKKFASILKNKNILFDKVAQYILKDKRPTKEMMHDRQIFLQKKRLKFMKSGKYVDYLYLISNAYNIFSPTKYYPHDYITNGKDFDDNLSRFNDIENRKVTRRQSNQDKKNKTSKQSKYTNWMHKNDIPTDYSKLAKYIKKKTGSKLSSNEILDILNQIDNRGLGAYISSGSRVGVSASQWGKARVYARVYDLLNNHHFKSDSDLLDRI